MKNPTPRTEQHLLCEVVSNVHLAPINPGHFRLTLHAPYFAELAVPGQFIHILPPSENDLLRRPISILDADPESGNVIVLYRVIGDGTRLISEVRQGDKLDIIGPLGNGFKIPDRKSVALFGGGIGIPPLVYLARKLLNAGLSPGNALDRSIQVYLGVREPEFLICLDDFTNLGINPVIYTETGLSKIRDHYGNSTPTINGGLITKAFDDYPDNWEHTIIYACGPVPMLKAVSEHADSLGLECYVSLENKLACGLGACLGCSIPVRNSDGTVHYERVCTEGPVFNSPRIAFDLM
ncbi:dihydroorotate dehydrogenase electron transfer subunit [bacterium]|nr:dihydroorotate dehydrogenase electron transfer subunit [bacterium]